MAEHWFLAKIYYSMPDLSRPEDPSGDSVITNLVKPVIAQCYDEGWIRWGAFMRFAEEGYHIRLTLYGEDETLLEQVQPYLQAEIARYRREFPDASETPMDLSPLAVRLNHKWGGAKESFRLRTPDSAVMGIAYETGEDEVFESPEAFAAHHNLHADGCARAIEFLTLQPTHKQRMAFARLLLDDMLRLTDLSHLELYCFLSYLQMQWIDYFAIQPQDLAPYERFYQERAPRYHQYLRGKRGPADSLPMLPPEFRPLYSEWIESLRTLIPPIIHRDEQGRMTPYYNLRILSFFHLMHNRIGVGLLQEIYLAHLLAEYYRTLLTPEQVAEADSWALALRNRTADAAQVAGG